MVVMRVMSTKKNYTCAAIIALMFCPGLIHAAPQPTPLTPELIEAAKKEGKIVYYTAIDIKVAQSLAKALSRISLASLFKWNAQEANAFINACPKSGPPIFSLLTR